MNHSFFRTSFLICLLILSSISTVSAETFPEVMFILDASGSMWGKVEDQTKIEAARSVMIKTVPALPPEVKVGLAVYGHRRKGDCSDIEILIPSGSTDRDGLLTYVSKISPKGMTPIADSIKMVSDTLKTNEGETTIVLVSDGEETCHADPCGLVKSLKSSGIKFILHVVGFDVNAEQKEQLACLAEAGGGQYFSADNTQTLLGAFESVKEEVVQKVEKAKTTTKKATTKLGKLQIQMPQSGTVSLNVIKIIRKKDGKLIKSIKNPGSDSTHPLLAGEYELIAGFANSNYKPDSEVSFGIWQVTGGETATVALGTMAINIADSLKDMPAGAAIITKTDDNDFSLALPFTGNSYYFYKTKPLPAGNYNFAVHYKHTYLYKTSERPVVLAKNIQIREGKENIVTIDSGIVVKEPKDTSIASWEITAAGGKTSTLKIEGATNGTYPLWGNYAVPPGTYDLYVYIEGMEEPLPAGEGITISKGELLEFDTGM